MTTTIRLGLTGGIGSGKSTVAGIFAQHGAFVIDADAVSRQASAAGGVAMPAIVREFGAAFASPDGSLNRDAMRALIFAEPAAKARLEAIIHPIVGQEIASQERDALASGSRLIVFDIPLLVESAHWRPRLDAVLVVDCAPETQIQRVMQRSGLKREQVQQIIDVQASRAQRLAAADIVICNDGIDIPALEQQVQALVARFGL
jgi:dephospho-CoA kinase